MAERVAWTTSEDGTFEYIQITKDQVEEALDVLHQSYFKDEPVCSAVGVAEHSEVFQDIDLILKKILAQGISLGCVEKATAKLVGVMVNEFLHKVNKEEEEENKEVKLNSQTIEFLRCCTHIFTFNYLEYCDVQNGIKIRHIGVLPTFRKRRIGRKLHDVALDLAKKLSNGEDVRVPTTDVKLEPLRRPKIVAEICTSPFTQKIIIDMGMEIAEKRCYKDIVTPNGTHLGSIIPDDSAYVAFGYLRL